jgi:heme-degrading monooxygenase HmoA
MIMRKWTGLIRTADSAAYTAYVEETGAAHYAQTEGNLGFQILLRDLENGTSEITTVSWWSDIEAIKRFAGQDCLRASYYPEDDRYLLDRPQFVEHHLVVTDGRPLSRFG